MTSTPRSRAGKPSLDAQWDVERLDVAAYLDRLGYHGDLLPSRATLAALHKRLRKPHAIPLTIEIGA